MTLTPVSLGMPVSRFLREYWQRKPLLVRGAFPGFESPLSPDDLASLACEPLATSRLVVHDGTKDRWQVRHGPFADSDFAALPERDWTLLVQDCDKLVADVGALLGQFRFVPDWRVDDVMVSFASDGGSVGAHVDQYDVFLLQAAGTRRWAIDERPSLRAGFREDAEIKLLSEFEPTHEWLLEPGDLLYLPPRVPHHGIALGDCMTFSIGMRAPSAVELLLDFAEHVAARGDEDLRLEDATRTPPRDAAQLGDDAVDAAAALLRAALDAPRAELRDWLARFLTRYRSAHAAAPRKRGLDVGSLRARLARGGALHRSPWSRYAFTRAPGGAALYLAGDRYEASLALARVLQAGTRYDSAALAALGQRDFDALCAMADAGHLVLAR